jgi:hypothetical protein
MRAPWTLPVQVDVGGKTLQINEIGSLLGAEHLIGKRYVAVPGIPHVARLHRLSLVRRTMRGKPRVTDRPDDGGAILRVPQACSELRSLSHMANSKALVISGSSSRSGAKFHDTNETVVNGVSATTEADRGFPSMSEISPK